jgi:hypothetical protein|tara:strand:- start:58 stop:381 length:324 start_codon:yes stop_codon:yes gene_type:complete
MKITNLIKYTAICGIFFLGACTHQNVKVVKPTDDKLSCSDIASEFAEINGVLKSIDDKTGLSGRNVAMGIFFWPGVVVNQMNAGDAREAANNRLVVLSQLKNDLNCS